MQKSAATKNVTRLERHKALTPRTRQRAREVLSTARKLFAAKGFEKTTTLEIAQSLGISEATVFTYFGSKRELCIQVIREWYDEISTEMGSEIALVHGTHAKLSYIVRKHLTALIRDGQGLCALVLTDGRVPGTEFADLLMTMQRRYTAPLMQVLAAAQVAGEIRSDISLRLMHNMFYGSMEHVMWDCIVNQQVSDLELTAHHIMEMLWVALAPPRLDLTALRQFQGDVADAVRRFEHAGEMPQ